MYAAMILAVGTAFVLTIWFCWFTLNLALDTSRETQNEARRYMRTNLAFAAVLVTILAGALLVLRVNGSI